MKIEDSQKKKKKKKIFIGIICLDYFNYGQTQNSLELACQWC